MRDSFYELSSYSLFSRSYFAYASVQGGAVTVTVTVVVTGVQDAVASVEVEVLVIDGEELESDVDVDVEVVEDGRSDEELSVVEELSLLLVLVMDVVEMVELVTARWYRSNTPAPPQNSLALYVQTKVHWFEAVMS